MAVQLEEGHAVAEELRDFGVEFLDLPAELLQRDPVRCMNSGEVGVDASILFGGGGHIWCNHSKRTSSSARNFSNQVTAR